MRSSKGFTMVELLVVLIILAILAAVATPMYLSNVNRARASEAVGTMSLIRQAIREYSVNHPAGVTIPITSGKIKLDPPVGAGVDVKIAKYFSNNAYTVVAASAIPICGTANEFKEPPAQDFIVVVNGKDTDQRTASVVTNCATDGKDVKGDSEGVGSYHLTMDNTGRAFVSYNNGSTCSQY